jgi:hypothetical protein
MFAASSVATAQGDDQDYTVGESIEVKWTDTWLKAKIIEARNGGFIIRYDVDGVQNFVTKDRMRRIAGAKRPAQTAHQPQDEQMTPAQPGKPKNTAFKYKIGDRVQCDRTGLGTWETGTVVPLRKTDFQDGRIYRVLLDSYSKAGLYLDGHDCTVESMRPLAGAAPFKAPTTAIPVGNVTVDDENTVSADRAIMSCPVPQTPVKNGARANIELFKKLIRCRKGEKAAGRGVDGAVTVEVTSLQPGATRPWEYGRDMGGKPGTIIHPVKATFHYKTFYRSSTQVSQNWISIINFYVNAFGEWETGSEESIKMGDTINIPRSQ